jgi:hypothetical protein
MLLKSQNLVSIFFFAVVNIYRYISRTEVFRLPCCHSPNGRDSEQQYNVTCRLKTGMVKPEQKSIAEQRIGNHVPATTNSNE